ncbi:MAG: c-type cytochrome [Nitrospirales bacterium]
MNQKRSQRQYWKIVAGFVCLNALLVFPHDGRSDTGQPIGNQVTINQVIELALQKVQGDIRKIDLQEKDRKNDWMVEILRPDGRIARVEVDSGTGQIISVTETTAYHMEGDRSKGKMVFEKLCVMCHGAEGRGDGTFGGELVPPAADLSSSKIQGNPDHVLFLAIKNGVKGSAMQGFKGRLSDQDIRDVLAYVRDLGKKSDR